MPVLTLEEITCENVDFSLTGCISESDDSLHISTLEETFKSFHLLVSHGINFSSEFEVTLFLHQLSDSQAGLLPDLLSVEVVSSCRDKLHNRLFLDLNVPLLGEF